MPCQWGHPMTEFAALTYGGRCLKCLTREAQRAPPSVMPWACLSRLLCASLVSSEERCAWILMTPFYSTHTWREQYKVPSPADVESTAERHT